jgi:hypothetical protein
MALYKTCCCPCKHKRTTRQTDNLQDNNIHKPYHYLSSQARQPLQYENLFCYRFHDYRSWTCKHSPQPDGSRSHPRKRRGHPEMVIVINQKDSLTPSLKNHAPTAFTSEVNARSERVIATAVSTLTVQTVVTVASSALIPLEVLAPPLRHCEISASSSHLLEHWTQGKRRPYTFGHLFTIFVLVTTLALVGYRSKTSLPPTSAMSCPIIQ